jgi:hypothetical protein
MRRRGAIGAIVRWVAACLAGGAAAAPCRSSGACDKWLAEFEREAIAQGISQQAISAAAPYLTYDQRIVNIDRGQRVFTRTFLEFSDGVAAAYRIQRGAALIKTDAQVFAKIDAQFGVPAPVIVSFWALESDFGANMGNYRTLSALASLAYDCRRADRFRAQLFDALRLIQRGRSRHQAATRQMRGFRRHARRWPAAAGRRFAGFTVAADGPLRPGLLGLRQFSRLSAVEQLATRIAGAPPLHRGNAPAPLAFADIKTLQASLVRAGYDVGAIDGFLGLKTRQAVKECR